MRFYELIKDTLGLKKGQSFMQTPDGMYVNSTNTVRLNSVMVENNTEYFVETEAPDMWKPTQNGEAFWTITPDGGTMELPWEEMKFGRLWQFGNVFRDKEQADEVAQAISVMFPTYQKKFNEYIAKNPKEPKMMAQPVQNFQQATPPIQQYAGGGVVPAGVVPAGDMPQQGVVPAPMPQGVVPAPMPVPMPAPVQMPRNIVNDPRFSPFNRFTTPGNER